MAISSTVIVVLVFGLCHGLCAEPLTNVTCGCNSGDYWYTEYFVPSAALVPPNNWHVYGQKRTTAKALCADDGGALAVVTLEDAMCLQQYVTYLFGYYDVKESHRIWVDITDRTTSCTILQKCREGTESGYVHCTDLEQWTLLSTDCSFTIRFLCQRLVHVEGYIPATPYIANAHMPDPSEFPTTNVTYTCKPGYEMSGSLPFTAQCSGWHLWTVPTQTCEAVSCKNLTTPDNGDLTLTDWFQFNSTARVTCHMGYVMVGQASITCQANRTWSDQLAQCNPVNCSSLAALPNSNVSTPNGTTLGSIGHIICERGYTGPNGFSVSTVVCQECGTWNDSSYFTCSGVNCGSVPSYSNSLASPYNATYPSDAVIVCNTGYRLEDGESNFTIQCLPSAQWQHPDMSCQAIPCDLLDDPIDGKLVYQNGSEYLAIAIFACDPWFEVGGKNSSVLQCLADGWNATVPQCVGLFNCSEEKKPDHGNYTRLLGYYDDEPNAVLLFSCDHGYTLVGEHAIRCTASGDWTSPPPTCEKDAVEPTTPAQPTTPPTPFDSVKIILVSVLGVVLFSSVGVSLLLFYRNRILRQKLEEANENLERGKKEEERRRLNSGMPTRLPTAETPFPTQIDPQPGREQRRPLITREESRPLSIRHTAAKFWRFLRNR